MAKVKCSVGNLKKKKKVWKNFCLEKKWDNEGVVDAIKIEYIIGYN